MPLISMRITDIVITIVSLNIIRITQQQTYTVTQQFHTNSFSDDDITGAINPWVVSGVGVPTFRYFTQCSGSRLFGGYKVLSGDTVNPAYVQKTWANLPPHYQATISMKIYKIDSWNSQSFFIMLDGTSIQILNWGTTTGTTDICGDPSPFLNTFNPQYNQLVYSYSQTVPHTASTLTLKLISNLNSWTGAWGIRQLTINLNRCHLSCLTCSNPTQCSTCDSANSLTLVGQFCECPSGNRRLIQTGCPVTQCVSCITTSCPVGYYDMNLTSCGSCNSACATCIGPGSLSPDCTTCNPSGYINPGTGICTVCYGFCGSCTGLLQNQCLSCLYSTYLNVNQCTSTCPAGTYGSQSRKTCIACTSPCATCDGSTSNHCLSCLATFYLYQNTCSNPCPGSMFGYNGLCLASCPLGTYPTTTFLCINCPSFCQTCDLTGLCTTCVVTAFFSPYDNLCHKPCPPAYYGDTSTYVCTTCDSSCLTCYGPTSSECSSCPPLTFLVYSTCYSTCPPHTYSLTCQLCHDSCLNCTGPSDRECTSCKKFDMLHLNLSKCLSQCLEGDIADNAVMTCLTCPDGQVGRFKKCIPCYPTCKTCSGIWYTDCRTCVNTSANGQQHMYLLNKVLYPSQIAYNAQAQTCVYGDSPIIYMPSIQNSSGSMYSALLFIVWINLVATLVLQIVLKYKTNLLLSIQTMQLLSYLYYFSVPFSQSNQITWLFLYHAHPTALIQLYNVFPSLESITSVPQHPNHASIFPKAILMHKSAIFIADTLYLHIFILLIIILFGILRVLRNNCWIYTKINPYLMTYSFRIVFMEFVFCAILFFTYIQLTLDIMRWSLGIIIVDILILAASFFWKVRTQLQPDHAHYALFYFNQLGPRKTKGKYLQLTQAQQKQRRSILPSLIHYISRIPIIVTIIIFHDQPLTQSICLLIYSVFLFGINYAIQYRRRAYRWMTLFTYFGLVLCAVFMVVMCCGIDVATYLNFWVLFIFSVLLACTIGQIITNHLFFLSIYDYAMAKYCGRPQDN